MRAQKVKNRAFLHCKSLITKTQIFQKLFFALASAYKPCGNMGGYGLAVVPVTRNRIKLPLQYPRKGGANLPSFLLGERRAPTQLASQGVFVDAGEACQF